MRKWRIPWQQEGFGVFDSRATTTEYLDRPDCDPALAAASFTEDLKKFDVPTLIIHGDDDQIVPIAVSACASAQLVKHASLKVYPVPLTASLTRTKTNSTPTCWHSLRPEEAVPTPPGWWRRKCGPYWLVFQETSTCR